MHALKRNILLRLQTLANLNNYPIIMINIIINYIINYLIIFSCHHFYPFKLTKFSHLFFLYPYDGDPKENKHISELF